MKPEAKGKGWYWIKGLDAGSKLCTESWGCVMKPVEVCVQKWFQFLVLES